LGTVAGAIADTTSNDDTYETLTEMESGGKPAKRRSELEHEWTFNVTGGELVTFYVEAHHTANSEGDDFLFAYSTDGTNYTDMVTVTKTADDDTAQSYTLPGSLSGTVYVRVLDTDRSQGNKVLDSLYVDFLSIVSEEALTTPNPATNPSPGDGATGVTSTPTLTWTAGALASSHDVYFGTNPTPGAGEFQGNQAGTSFSPGTLPLSTLHYWAVDEVNGAGTTLGPVWSFTTGGASATDLHVENIVASEVAVNSKAKGRATVTVHDDLGAPVANATVTGSFTGDFNETQDGVTDANGVVVLTTSSKASSPSFTFTVDDITHATLPYDSNDNVITSVNYP